MPRTASTIPFGRVTVINRGPDTAVALSYATVWFRNTWAWGYGTPRPELSRYDSNTIELGEAGLGEFKFWMEDAPQQLYTENESNNERLWNSPNISLTRRMRFTAI